MLLLKVHVDVKVVADPLGHGMVAITLDIYAHVLLDMLRDAVAAITAALTLDAPAGSGREVVREVVAEAELAPAIVCPHCGQAIGGDRFIEQTSQRTDERVSDEDQDRVIYIELGSE